MNICGDDLFYGRTRDLSGEAPVYETAFVFMEEEYEDVDVPPWAIKIILEEGLDF